MMRLVIRWVSATGMLMALLALAGCAPASAPTATPVTLPLETGRPTALFLYTDN